MKANWSFADEVKAGGIRSWTATGRKGLYF